MKQIEKRISVGLSKEEYEQIKNIAHNEYRTPTGLIRHWVKRELKMIANRNENGAVSK